jgi:hypothetical protein
MHVISSLPLQVNVTTPLQSAPCSFLTTYVQGAVDPVTIQAPYSVVYIGGWATGVGMCKLTTAILMV